MRGLTLRKEFQGRRPKGTAVELSNEKKTGATQIPARDFLEITYPTGDLLTSAIRLRLLRLSVEANVVRSKRRTRP
jgi:hypothetical protein